MHHPLHISSWKGWILWFHNAWHSWNTMSRKSSPLSIPKTHFPVTYVQWNDTINTTLLVRSRSNIRILHSVDNYKRVLFFMWPSHLYEYNLRQYIGISYGHNTWALPYYISWHEAIVVAVATDVQTCMMKSKQSWNVTTFIQTLMVPVALPVFVPLTTAPRRNDGMCMAYTNILHSCRESPLTKLHSQVHIYS